MTADYTNQVATALLLSTLAGLFAVGALAAVWVPIYLRRAKSRVLASPASLRGPLLASRCEPLVFGQSCRWVVVKGCNIAAVQRVLGLHNPTPCSWNEGVGRLISRHLFISPPLRGWILILGQGLPDPSEDADQCFHFVRKLSGVLGQVQFYSLDRGMNHHAWARADGGNIQRAYAWAGETLWNQGEVTQAEKDLGFQCLAYGQSGSELEASSLISNTENVLRLAAQWSFDPTALDISLRRVGLGVVGDLAQSKPH